MNVVPVAIIQFFQFVHQEVNHVKPVANPHMGPVQPHVRNLRQNFMPTERLFSRGLRVRITCVAISSQTRDTMQAHTCFTTKQTLAVGGYGQIECLYKRGPQLLKYCTTH